MYHLGIREYSSVARPRKRYSPVTSLYAALTLGFPLIPHAARPYEGPHPALEDPLAEGWPLP